MSDPIDQLTSWSRSVVVRAPSMAGVMLLVLKLTKLEGLVQGAMQVLTVRVKLPVPLPRSL